MVRVFLNNRKPKINPDEEDFNSDSFCFTG